jgi:hypothetical protein
MVDPFVLPLGDGSFGLCTRSEQEGMISAASRDGLVFTRDAGIRTGLGGMPSVLRMRDNQVRMFSAGVNEGKEGIFSAISEDGLNFTVENGVRIESPPDIGTDNPQMIQLANGTYLMLYQTHNRIYDAPGNLPWEHIEIHLATSTDSYNWTTNPTVIMHGGTSCVIETEDGSLFIYYVNR